MNDKHIGLLMGGESSERAVSLKSGAAIKIALEKLQYHVTTIDPATDHYIDQLKGVDRVFNALHGTYGEDGLIQGLLECLKIPYTGTSVTGSAIAMDKIYSRMILQQSGIKTIPFEQIDTLDAIKHLSFQQPLMIKPINEGSSVGVSLVETSDQLSSVAQNALNQYGTIIVEPYIDGKEIQIAVLNGDALGGIEIQPSNQFYDYEAKYLSNDTKYIVPPEISQCTLDKLLKQSEHCFKTLRCNGVIRVDYLVQNEDTYLLEVNTLPGMTQSSLVPKIAAWAGYSFEDLCQHILQTATLHRR